MAESTVLVVDDEPLILAFLAENLRADDFTVLTATNGGEAIDALAASRPTSSCSMSYCRHERV